MSVTSEMLPDAVTSRVILLIDLFALTAAPASPASGGETVALAPPTAAELEVNSSSSYINMSHEPSYRLILLLTGVTGEAVESVIGEFVL